MMEENIDIFLAGDDALVYLAGPMHKKKYSTTFVWGHPFTTYISQDQFFNPTPPEKYMNAFRVTVTVVGLLKKNSFKHNRTYFLKNMTQMLQVNKNSNFKYNLIQVKLN